MSQRAIAPYHLGDYYYTRSKDSKTLHVFHIQENKAQYEKPKSFEFEVPTGFQVKSIEVLGSKEKVKWKLNNNKISIKAIKYNPDFATVLRLVAK